MVLRAWYCTTLRHQPLSMYNNENKTLQATAWAIHSKTLGFTFLWLCEHVKETSSYEAPVNHWIIKPPPKKNQTRFNRFIHVCSHMMRSPRINKHLKKQQNSSRTSYKKTDSNSYVYLCLNGMGSTAILPATRYRFYAKHADVQFGCVASFARI